MSAADLPVMRVGTGVDEDGVRDPELVPGFLMKSMVSAIPGRADEVRHHPSCRQQTPYYLADQLGSFAGKCGRLHHPGRPHELAKYTQRSRSA